MLTREKKILHKSWDAEMSRFVAAGRKIPQGAASAQLKTRLVYQANL